MRTQPITTLVLGGRRFQIYGSEQIGHVILSRSLPGDPLEREGGYHPYGYPHAATLRIEDAGGGLNIRRAWGVRAPYPEGWAVYDAEWEPLPCNIFGFARTSEEAWQIAAQSLTDLIAARYARHTSLTPVKETK